MPSNSFPLRRHERAHVCSCVGCLPSRPPHATGCSSSSSQRTPPTPVCRVARGVSKQQHAAFKGPSRSRQPPAARCTAGSAAAGSCKGRLDLSPYVQGSGDSRASTRRHAPLLASNALQHVLDARHHALQAAEVDVRAVVQQIEHLVSILLHLRINSDVKVTCGPGCLGKVPPDEESGWGCAGQSKSGVKSSFDYLQSRIRDQMLGLNLLIPSTATE